MALFETISAIECVPTAIAETTTKPLDSEMSVNSEEIFGTPSPTESITNQQIFGPLNPTESATSQQKSGTPSPTESATSQQIFGPPSPTESTTKQQIFGPPSPTERTISQQTNQESVNPGSFEATDKPEQVPSTTSPGIKHKITRAATTGITRSRALTDPLALDSLSPRTKAKIKQAHFEANPLVSDDSSDSPLTLRESNVLEHVVALEDIFNLLSDNTQVNYSSKSIITEKRFRAMKTSIVESAALLNARLHLLRHQLQESQTLEEASRIASKIKTVNRRLERRRTGVNVCRKRK